MRLINAAVNGTNNVSIAMNIDVTDAAVGNICAHTRTGIPTKTIVLGAHSDGVLDGSGINDNGMNYVYRLIN